MTKHIKVINDEGVPFNVRIVEQGDNYGLNNALVHDKVDPLVEFYDARQDPEKFTELGQFVTRYYKSTLIDREEGHGLHLYMDVPSWRVSGENMDKVQEFLKGFDVKKINSRVTFIRSEQLDEFDHYMFEDKSQLSTKDVTITVDHDNQEITGDTVAYGSWYDLEREDCIGYLEVLKENEILRNFDHIKTLEQEKTHEKVIKRNSNERER